ncbi:HdeA/HdeB family chaperone [Caballeronia sordidicola]|nr:HdeA/HdeB family chaperone [Caballeronia sordidicola]
MMKLTPVLLALCGVVLASTAVAQTPKEVSPSKMKCNEFVTTDEAYRPALVYWVAGVDKLGVSEKDRLILDTAHPVDEVITECKKTPDALFMNKVRQMYRNKQITLNKTYAHN